ncbi:MAG: hypothetical protein IPJ82_16005 [Lewinellaceae bacterium]|nr:hypothetical protein [Lewinellaceae bacterium]
MTGNKGSAHSYSPLFGWSKAYPETTGYLIDTLCDYAAIRQDDSLRSLAFDCARWLVSIQFPDGAFPGLLAGNSRPSVFNTSQILFGLARTAEEATQEADRQAARASLEKAANWLVSQLEPDYSWRKHAYVPGFTPTYYTRAVWGVLRANQILQNVHIQECMQQALLFYAARIKAGGSVCDWGFRPGKPAFTHTIAYTFEGFLESAILLKEEEIIEKKIFAGEKFILVRSANNNRTAGCYDEQWRGDYSFRCLTGNCQLSLFFHRLGALTGDKKYAAVAHELLMEVVGCQKLAGNPNTVGAMPGSAPVWGPYARFLYPNWGVKFFLDAMKFARRPGSVY